MDRSSNHASIIGKKPESSSSAALHRNEHHYSDFGEGTSLYVSSANQWKNLEEMKQERIEGFRNETYTECIKQEMSANAEYFKTVLYPQWSNLKPTDKIAQLQEWSAPMYYSLACQTFARLVLEEINKHQE